jgi:glycerol uptake facilitator-like aquaporin
MFHLPVWQLSSKSRSEPSLWVSELISTMILLSLVRSAARRQDPKTPVYVACTVFPGYWATSSTFFANPAATLARSLTNTFVGIRPVDVGPFMAAQGLALVLVLILNKLWRR